MFRTAIGRPTGIFVECFDKEKGWTTTDFYWLKFCPNCGRRLTENEKKKSDAKAYDSEAILRTFTSVDKEVVKALVTSGMDSRALIARAFVEIGDKADKIGVLNVSPDLLESLANA